MFGQLTVDFLATEWSIPSGASLVWQTLCRVSNSLAMQQRTLPLMCFSFLFMALDDLGGVCLEPCLGRASCGSNAAMIGVDTFHLAHYGPVPACVIVGTWFLAARFAVAFPCYIVQ